MARANWTGQCHRCEGPIRPGDDVVRRHGSWIHARCAPGGDDE